MLRTGSCSGVTLLLFLAYQQVPTTVVLLEPGWEQAVWFSPGHSQDSCMRAPAGGQMVTPGHLEGQFLCCGMGFHQCQAHPDHKIYECMWQLISYKTIKKGHTWGAGYWDGKASKPFWNWLAKKTWNKEYFQTGASGSWRHPHGHSLRGCHKWMVSKGAQQSF